MNKAIYVEVRELPDTLQRALEANGYHRKDIGVTAQETACLQGAGGDGYREFVVFINLATGESKRTNGSWGGANIFNPHNAVDTDSSDVPIPDGVAVIRGTEGGSRPVYASVLVNPSAMPALLPDTPQVRDLEASILGIYKSIKGGYRKGELDRIAATSTMVDSLVERGYLKRNKAGATQITTKGKNAAGRIY